MARILLVSILALCGPLSSITYNAIKAEQLPSLWDSLELDNADQAAGLYRIVSEIYLDDNKDSYLVEEWLDGPGQVFRMDVLNLHDDLQAEAGLATTRGRGTKRTLLVRGATSERYLLEPFQCSPFESITWSLESNLATRFPRNGHPIALAGVGALWLFASAAQLASGGVRPSVFEAAKMPPGPRLETKRTRSRTMRTFDMFEVPEQPGSEFPYKIRFYFLPNEWRSPSGKLNHNALISVHLIDASPGPVRIRMNARVLEIDVDLQSLPGVTSNVFELPLGYGCARHGLEEATVRDEYKPPSNCFDDDYSAQGPHMCNIEVVSYLPHAPGEDLDKWAVHTSSIRLVSGRLLGRQYLTVEGRDSVIQLGRTTTAPKRSVLRRSKRIWDLGVAWGTPPEIGDHAQRSEAHSTPPMYFEPWEDLRVCHAHGNAQLNELPSMEFALNSQMDAIGESPGEPIKKLLVGLSLVDERSISELFRDTTGFHLVREVAAPWPHYREMHQEKRLDRLELRGQSGQLGWSGPASLVRRWYSPVTRAHGEAGPTPPPAEARDVRLTIYLFESMALKLRQIGRLQLTMSPGHQVNEAYLHRELDLGPCIASAPSDNRLLRAQRDSLAFRLTYPLDAPNTQVLALRSDYHDQIYAKFLKIVSQSVLFAASADSPALEFHPMQLSELKVDVESNLISVSARLHKWREVFNYIKYPPVRIRESKANNKQLVLMMSELKSTSETCAQSCAHYACPLFVYDQIGKQCHIYHKSASSARVYEHEQLHERRPAINSSAHQRPVGQPLSALKYDAYCAVYERAVPASGWASRAATPRQMVERMNEWLERELGDDASEKDSQARTNPLTLELEPLRAEDRMAKDDDDDSREHKQSEPIVLVPSSLHVGSDLRVKANLLLGQAAESQLDYQGEHNHGNNRLAIKAEFEILYKSRKFRSENFHHRLPDNEKGESWFPIEEANSIENQWDCELLCRELDCRSYSYCQLSQKCLVSKLQWQSAIEPATEEASFCLVLAREYLSKFGDKFKSQISARELEVNQAIKPQLSLQIDSARDCAIGCLDAIKFTCRSFVLCPGRGQFGCHMFGELNPLVGDLARARAAPAPKSQDNSTDEFMCDLYQRSLLVDYQQFYGKQLDASKSGQSIKLLRGLDAEDCASACSQAIDNDGHDDQQEVCGAFHVCLHKPGQGKRHQLLCGLLIRALNDSEQSPAAILQDEPNCSAFAPYISSRPARSSSESAIEPSELSSRNQGEKSTNGSHNLAFSLIVILVGLAIGYALTWLIALQNLVTFPGLLLQSMNSGV